jgi:integrase
LPLLSAQGVQSARSLACPAIGARPIAGITAPEVLAVLRPVESRGRHETARRLRATIGEVFRYAVATGRADVDPTGALKLAPRTKAILHDLQKLTGGGKFLFPSVRSASRCMSENTINAALRRMGFTKDEMCGHGFRAVASTLLNESGKWNADAIEAQLAHVENDAVRRAYHRADYWSERVSMMAYWADYLDELRIGGKVIACRA